MKTTFGRCVFAVAMSLFGLVGGSAFAQGYPSKPIRIVVPFAPGGASDVLARLVGQKLSERMGQPVVVENRPGATTTVGAAEVAKAPADGYTLLLAPAPFIIAPLMYQKLSYDTARDFAGVALLSSAPLILTAHPSVGASTAQELLALAKAKPGTIMYGSPGSGSVPHLATELFKLRTGHGPHSRSVQGRRARGHRPRRRAHRPDVREPDRGVAVRRRRKAQVPVGQHQGPRGFAADGSVCG